MRFIRSYFAIVFGILLIAVALDTLLAALLPDQNQSNAGRYRDSFALIRESVLPAGAGGEELAAAFAARRAGLEAALGFPVALYSRSDFAGPEDLQPALAEGEILSLFDAGGGEILYQNVPHSDHVLALGPLPPPAAGRSGLELAVITAYYFLVAFIVFLWIRPFYRDLGSLRNAASQFGRNDFSSRVEVAKSSSILPLALSFNAMAERIQYLVSAHRELTNAVSHELRTPLARFKFSLEILAKTEDPAKKASYLASMKGDVQELEDLIDEMLSYARLSEENLRLNLVEVNLRAWLQELLAQYDKESVRLEFSYNASPLEDRSHASFNPELMARALNNVLRNCLRYATSRIAIAAQLGPEEAEIRICDDGPGIPEDMREKIFEPFSRLDTSRDKQSGGYGLGLAIANRILQRHGGSIRVRNSEPSGACFILRWPR